MSALVIDQLTSKSEINDHTHLSRYKLTEQKPSESKCASWCYRKKMRRRKMNKHSRQVGVLSSNLICWPDLERPVLKYRNCSHGMVWLAPHQAWYLAGCYVCILKGIAKTYDFNVLPNQAKNIFPSPHILQFYMYSKVWQYPSLWQKTIKHPYFKYLNLDKLGKILHQQIDLPNLHDYGPC